MKFASRLQRSKPLRFILTGGLNTLIGLAVYSLSIISGAAVWLAVLIGMLAGIAFNFLTIGGYVFRDLSPHRLPRFVLTYFVVFALNLGMIELFGAWIIDKILLQTLITPPLALISYVLMGRFVFQSAKPNDQGLN